MGRRPTPGATPRVGAPVTTHGRSRKSFCRHPSRAAGTARNTLDVLIVETSGCARYRRTDWTATAPDAHERKAYGSEVCRCTITRIDRLHGIAPLSMSSEAMTHPCPRSVDRAATRPAAARARSASAGERGRNEVKHRLMFRILVRTPDDLESPGCTVRRRQRISATCQ